MTLAAAIGILAYLPFGLGAFWGVRAWRQPGGEDEHRADGAFAIACWMFFLSNVMAENVFQTIVNGLVAVLFTWSWWNNRRGGGRRHARRELGDKSRRLLEALSDRVTPPPAPDGGAA